MRGIITDEKLLERRIPGSRFIDQRWSAGTIAMTDKRRTMRRWIPREDAIAKTRRSDSRREPAPLTYLHTCRARKT